MRRVYVALMAFMLPICVVVCQDSTKTIIAKKGDGIINVLRSHGMNVTKYYERFLDLNKGNIRKGSELHLGRTYYLPDAPDSFENMGRKMLLPNRMETAIFSDELFNIRKTDNFLENTVYYMVLNEFDRKEANSAANDDRSDQDIAENMAKELLSHGAKVYMIQNEVNQNVNLGEYASAITRLYLKHNGEYQRLLVMNLKTVNISDSTKITIAHHDKSKQGQKLASSIGKVFREQNVLKKSSEEYANIFTDKNNLYLAKNAMPVMTFIKIEGDDVSTGNLKKTVKKDVDFADLIASGILQDYTGLDFEDKD